VEAVGQYPPRIRFFLDQQVEDTYRDMIRQQQLMTASNPWRCSLPASGSLASRIQLRTADEGDRHTQGDGRGNPRHHAHAALAIQQAVFYGSLIAWPVAAYIMHRWLQGFAYHVELGPWAVHCNDGIDACHCADHGECSLLARRAGKTCGRVALRVGRSTEL